MLIWLDSRSMRVGSASLLSSLQQGRGRDDQRQAANSSVQRLASPDNEGGRARSGVVHIAICLLALIVVSWRNETRHPHRPARTLTPTTTRHWN